MSFTLPSAYMLLIISYFSFLTSIPHPYHRGKINFLSKPFIITNIQEVLIMIDKDIAWEE
jgi:hypothetical protein